MTSTHVIEQANHISIPFRNDERFQGARVDADPNTDIAVITVVAADLIALPMGDLDMLAKSGDDVIAVGNPLVWENCQSC